MNARKYRYITITKWQPLPSLLLEYQITNNKSGVVLGSICHYLPWKQWVFESQDRAVWSIDCLECVISFMKELAEKRSA